MSLSDFKSAKAAVLTAMYEHMMSSSGAEWVPAEEINNSLSDPYPIVYIRKILESLESEELVTSRTPPNAGYSLYSIDEDGILTVQQRLLPNTDPLPSNLEGQEGDVHLELLPASDRMVPINHNQPEYQEIRKGINDLYDEFRSSNDLPIESDERDRILTSLMAAKALWDSVQLKVMQLRVGVILAIEDAVAVLQRVGKATGPALLVGAIKAFVKHTTGIDL